MNCDHKHAHCCDDQLPVIATMGRGPKGDSAIVQLGEPDTCTETYVEGWTVDDQGNIVANSAWRTENINGGELSHYYTLRPFTNPRTFTMTFVYRRPGRCEWSWTTPAIPYIWSLDENGVVEDAEHVVGSGVATLFIREGANAPWIEKLVYPEGTTRDDFNAPGPEEAWTANITLGIGGDVNVPNLDDISKIVGISPGDILNIIRKHPGTFPDFTAQDLRSYIDSQDNNLRKYIEGMVDKVSVVSTNTDMLKVTTTKYAHVMGNETTYGIKHELTPANITAGAGIQVTKKPNGDIQISNAQVAGNYETLVAGRDFNFKWHNGWYMGDEVSRGASENNQGPLPGSKPQKPWAPTVKVLINRDSSGNISSAEVKVSCSDSTNDKHLENIYDLLETTGTGENKTLKNFMFRHAESADSRPLSIILSLEFIDNYAPLNDMSIVAYDDRLGIWNVKGTNDKIDVSTAAWHVCGACWDVYGHFTKGVTADNPYTFTLSAIQIGDGYNNQYSTPGYEYTSLGIMPWANCSTTMTLI